MQLWKRQKMKKKRKRRIIRLPNHKKLEREVVRSKQLRRNMQKKRKI